MELFKNLPPWAKGAIAVTVTAGAVVGIFYTVKAIKKRINQPSDEESLKELIKKNEDELSQNKNKGFKLTFPESQYNSMANQIYEGMRYCLGDDYASVEKTLLKMKNDLDVNYLVKAFGKRQGYCFGIPEGGLRDLFTFVRSELGTEYGGLSDSRLVAVNKDWVKKGIKYKF
jgi:uncharacterized protein YneF (UPF0154 family)